MWLVAGIIAWFAAPWLSRRVYSKTGDQVNIDVSADTLVAVGGFLIGGFFLVSYFPRLIVDLGWWFSYLAEERPLNEGELVGSGPRYLLEWRSTISNLLIVSIAAFMALRPAYLARIFSWLRNAGQYEEKSQTSAHSRESGNP